MIGLGCLKLVYNHWRLRKYTAIAATKAAVRHEMQHSASVKRGRGKEVPFGIRAIESGIEVDGVWISGSNTPANSTPGSPALSAKSVQPRLAERDQSPDRTSSPSKMTRIEIPPPAQGFQGSSSGQASSSRPPSTIGEHPRGRPTYQPRHSSGLRYSDTYDQGYRSAALASLEGRQMINEPTGKATSANEERESESEHRSWSGSSSTESHEATNQLGQSNQSRFTHNGFLTPTNLAAHTGGVYHPIAPGSDDTSRLESGRHSARIRNGKEVAHTPPIEDMLGQTNSHGETSRHRPASSASDDSDPFITPTRMSVDAHIAELHLDGGFDDAATHHAQLMDTNDITYDQGHAQPLRPFEANGPPRQSQVIRKINSGFEILRPGTLDRPLRNSINTEWKESEPNNKRQSKKLQRRNRASSGSQSIESAPVKSRGQSHTRN